MQDDQKRAVDQIWSRRASGLPLRSPYELVTLASIVEKETGKADERPRVASVFVNRLRNRMRLQSDPTIVYGLAGGKGSLGRAITRAELEKPTPYNTYLIDGLPPGPIANPGRAALEAVANPSRTQDLYFVADGTGGHVFSETLDQHSRNVQRWRQIEKDAKDKQEQPAPDMDKTAPETAPAATQPGAGQKSESGMPSSVYGSLPASLDAPRSATPRPPSLSYAHAASAIAGAMRVPASKTTAVKAHGKYKCLHLGAWARRTRHFGGRRSLSRRRDARRSDRRRGCGGCARPDVTLSLLVDRAGRRARRPLPRSREAAIRRINPKGQHVSRAAAAKRRTGRACAGLRRIRGNPPRPSPE